MKLEDFFEKENKIKFVKNEIQELLDINLSDLRVLHAIYKQDNMEMVTGEIVEKCQMKRSIVTRITKSLENKGYISRKKDLDDERKIIAYISQEKKEEVEIIFNFIDEILNKI